MKQTIISTENNVMHLEREFDAPVAEVWRAWTEPELLDKWWAPLPYITVTKSMNFSEGGKWHYYMLSPEGQKHWCIVKYLKIDLLKSYKATDAFADENGNENKELPNGIWTNEFIATSTGSKVKITISYSSKEDLKRIIEMGMQEGITMTLTQLDALLKK